MVSNVDYTSPSAQFTFDVNTNNFFVKDNQNFINLLGINQLNTLENVSLLDIYLSKDNVVEPHYHQNAAELVYCISGAANVSLLNPFTKRIQTYSITPGQVANIPQGWWHYEEATIDQTHLLAIFDAPTPEVILGSDILKLTPSNIMAKTYCLDEKKWKKAIAPIQTTTFIGPPKNCTKQIKNKSQQYPYQYVNCYNMPQYTIPSYYWYPYQNSIPYYRC
ncbi:cupin domain-containing protein [Bacillus sp. JJ722]|uniref:cupin domain-containing protein n=1 Tax=Bacillus sp. JJ722 TaxID=3122973 RepID=UPI002FFFF207